MGVDHRFPAIELFPHRREGGVAEVFILVSRHEAQAFGLERIECVLDFLQASFDIGQRQRREVAEATRVVARELRRIVVALARDLAALFQVTCGGARLHERHHRQGNAALVHLLDRHGRRPLHRRARAAAGDFIEIAGINEMVVNVDTVRFATRGGFLRLLRKEPAGKNGGGTHRCEPAQESAPRRAAAAGQAGSAVVF